MYLIGYDIGSSTIKASLINPHTDEVLGTFHYPERDMDMISRQSGWAEQQPEIWWQDFCFATRQLLAQTNIEGSDVSAIGLSYQMHGLVLIDKEQKVLRPSIIWCDSRAVSIGDQAFYEIGQRKCLENFLNSPGNFTASRLKWVKDNEPAIYDKTFKFLLPGDYIAMKLTGNVNTTVSGLTEAILWDFKKKRVASEIVEYFDLSNDKIPESIGSVGMQGCVTNDAAIMSGLTVGTPLTFRAGDQPTNALALNVLKPGEIAASCGTSGVVYGIVDKPIYDQKSRVNAFGHVNYELNHDRIGILLCINGAGMQYGWMKKQIALTGRSYEDMERMASTVPIGSDGLCILPFGNGSERLLENKNLKSHIQNLQFNRHGRAHLFRASLEGVAFSFVYGIEILKEMGMKLDVLRVANDNMFQSEIFSNTIATLLNCRLEMFDTTGAIAAAKASGVAIGKYKNIEEALGNAIPFKVYKPSLSEAQCRQAYEYWKSNLNSALIDNPNSDWTAGLINGDINNEIASLALQLTTKNELLEEIKSGLETNPSAAQLQQMIHKIDQSIGRDSYWKKFDEHLEFVESDFYKTLREKHQKLTNQDIRLCLLIKLNLSTKEIAQQLNMSVRGVETKRYRLRKKLNPGTKSLEQYLVEFDV